MPIETRRIEFSEIELRNALAFYHSKTEGGAPDSVRISGIKVMGGDDFNVVAKVSTARDDVLSRKVFDHATCVAVMVLFSKKNSIPLPREGRKVLSPTRYGGLAMTIRYEHQIPGLKMASAQLALLKGANAIAPVVGNA